MLIESDSEMDGAGMDTTEPDDGSPEHSRSKCSPYAQSFMFMSSLITFCFLNESLKFVVAFLSASEVKNNVCLNTHPSFICC